MRTLFAAEVREVSISDSEEGEVKEFWPLLLLLLPPAVIWLVHRSDRKMRSDLVEAIKARGHWAYSDVSGKYEWVPGTWKTPSGG